MKIDKRHLAFKLMQPASLRTIYEAKGADPIELIDIGFPYFRKLFNDLLLDKEKIIYAPTESFCMDAQEKSNHDVEDNVELSFPSSTGIVIIADKAICFSVTDESLMISLMAEQHPFGFGTVGFMGIDFKDNSAKLLVPSFLKNNDKERGMILASMNVVLYIGIKRSAIVETVASGGRYTKGEKSVKNQSSWPITILDRSYKVTYSIPEKQVEEHFRNQWYGSLKRGNRRQELIIVTDYVRKAHTRNGTKKIN